jgi:hypothetical protein
MGGSSLADAGKAITAGASGPDATARLRASIEAAFKTSKLVDNMIMVTKDDSFQEYPAARHISFAYKGIIDGMQPSAAPQIASDVQSRIDEATKVLYEVDPKDGSITGKSKLFENYRKNATAYAKAVKDYADAQDVSLNDPTKAASTPTTLLVYQQVRDDALADLKAEGGAKVENALAVLASVGIGIQSQMVSKAKGIYDAWNLGLAGVPDPVPYSYMSPSGWADPDSKADGWERLEVKSSEYQSHSEFHHAASAEGAWESHYSKSEGGGGFSIFGFGASGGGGKSESEWSSTYESSDGTKYQFHNDAKNLSIELEWALCSINRPWFLGDLFYLSDWYVAGARKKSISDGTIDGQVLQKDPLLPMIPVQFLVVRNLKISATRTDWGGDGETLRQMHADASAKSSSWTAGGGGGFSCGFFSIGGSGSHSEGSSSSQFHNRMSEDGQSNFGWSFDGENLEIRGAQIMAWLSEILPPSAPLDDPTLG